MDWVLAPIYRKGAKMLSGKEATGKNPTEDAHKRSLNRDDAALIIENNSSVGAVGLFTGPKGNGIVILDVDFQLSTYRKKWGNTLDGAPVVRSTKANAAKFLFRVPEELWRDVAGFGLCEQRGRGYEALWNRQGLIYGEYPGSKDGKAPEGHYHFEGDPESIPEAPGWLIAEMRAAKAPTTFVKNRSALDVSDRSEDDIAVIIQECTNVIPHEGVGSREHWLKVGMAIHSVLPNDLGLTLWSAWSAKDPEYHDHWVDGNPCEGQWSSFKPGGIGLGTLIWMADAVDPKRRRFSDTSKDIIEAAEAARVQEMRISVLSHAEIIKQAKEILELDNPSEINHRMNGLAIAAGYRDRVAIEQLLLSQLEYERKESCLSWAEMKAKKFEKSFLIPDILPHPSVVLLYGAGGDGKSMTAWTLAKHVAMGLPFVVRGQLMPVKKGPVLLLNGDQSEQLIQEQLEEIEMPEAAPVFVQQGWQLKRYNEFIRLIEKHKPALVVIDSLIGCSSGDAFDENKSEFASPLYWLSKNNGVLYPATTIIIIHHANKTGGFRGSSAIRDAVDETWAMKRPSGGENSLPANCRIINIEKSRSGRGGTSLLMKMEDDLTFSVSDFVPEVDESKTTPDGIVDRVLMRIRTSYPRAVSKQELDQDRLVGGNIAGIIKSLQRLEKKGLITSEKEEGRYGKKLYKAILARGEAGGDCPPFDSPSPAGGPRVDNGGDSSDLSTLKSEGGQPSSDTPACPPSEPSGGKGSAQGGQPDKYPRAREQDDMSSIDQNYW